MNRFPEQSHVFVDESKTRGYYMVAAAAAPGSVAQLRSAVRTLCRPGQRRIHFTREGAASRHRILAGLEELRVQSVVYVVRGRSDKEARTLCLREMTGDLVDSHVRRLLIERDESVEAADRRIIARRLGELGARAAFEYVHEDAYGDPLLWVSDAVAWCHQAGGDWRRRAEPLTSALVRLP